MNQYLTVLRPLWYVQQRQMCVCAVLGNDATIVNNRCFVRCYASCTLRYEDKWDRNLELVESMLALVSLS